MLWQCFVFIWHIHICEKSEHGPVKFKEDACQAQPGHWLSLVHSSDLRQNIISFKFFFFIFGSSYYENLKVVLQPVAIWRVLLQYLWQFGKPIGKDAEVAKHLLHTQPHQKSRHLKQEITQRFIRKYPGLTSSMSKPICQFQWTQLSLPMQCAHLWKSVKTKLRPLQWDSEDFFWRNPLCISCCCCFKPVLSGSTYGGGCARCLSQILTWNVSLKTVFFCGGLPASISCCKPVPCGGTSGGLLPSEPANLQNSGSELRNSTDCTED